MMPIETSQLRSTPRGRRPRRADGSGWPAPTPTTATRSRGWTAWPRARSSAARCWTAATSPPSTSCPPSTAPSRWPSPPSRWPARRDLFPSGLLNRRTIALANEVWYRKTPATHHHLAGIGGFFHPLDGIRDWNRVYGRAGFVQYQFVIPFSAGPTLRRIVERISRAQAPSFVTVLKRFGKGSPGYLSFPTEGWTLALDFPTGTPNLDRLLSWLDEQVLSAAAGFISPRTPGCRRRTLAAMYPRLDDFREVRAKALIRTACSSRTSPADLPSRKQKKKKKKKKGKKDTDMKDALGRVFSVQLSRC